MSILLSDLALNGLTNRIKTTTAKGIIPFCPRLCDARMMSLLTLAVIREKDNDEFRYSVDKDIFVGFSWTVSATVLCLFGVFVVVVVVTNLDRFDFLSSSTRLYQAL